MRTAAALLATLTVISVAACSHPTAPAETPEQWVSIARGIVRDRCTDEADTTGAADQVWQNVYDNCAARNVMELLNSPTRPSGRTGCEAGWCHG